MNILYDGPFEPLPKGGVVRYFHQMADKLARHHHIGFTRRAAISGTKNFLKLPPFAHFRPHRVSFFIELFWYKFFSKDIPDIVHPTEFGLSPTGKYFNSKGSKVVMTIHDLIHEKFGAPGNLYDEFARKDFYSKADGFIFVSNSTKNDFIKYYPEFFESRDSKVIWHGINFPTRTIKPVDKKKQFLFVGSRAGYKNFKTAVDAFLQLVSKFKDSYLVVAGAAPSIDEIESTVAFEKSIKWVVHPNDQFLQNLYSESIALLYVSKYEGFGMPLVEAMSQGCIPIAGSHSSIPEVIEEAGILADVNDPVSIADAMLKCINNETFVQSKILLGRTRCESFSWEKSAKETLDFYKTICKTF